MMEQAQGAKWPPPVPIFDNLLETGGGRMQGNSLFDTIVPEQPVDGSVCSDNNSVHDFPLCTQERGGGGSRSQLSEVSGWNQEVRNRERAQPASSGQLAGTCFLLCSQCLIIKMTDLSVQERAVGAVVGSLVADAAGQPLHWIYDVKRLDQILKGREGTPEFVDPGQGPFYRQPTGAQSGYGDQTLALLKALVAGKGFDVQLYRQELYKTFGPNSEYDLKGKLKGQDQVQTGGYRHASIKAFLTAYEARKENTGSSTDPQMDGVAKVAPIVALYAGDPKLPQYVEEVVRVTQDDNLAVQCSIAAAVILEEFILHPPREGFLDRMKNRLELRVIAGRLPEILQQHTTAHREVVQQIGSSCVHSGTAIWSYTQELVISQFRTAVTLS
ncbi:selenoprotein J isoform X2 [Chiloscyllium plagiosum]|uniref:selenoprotein J isoform X2 n=1 Tax=Chiloscyllium plagiosum TaxID=36176 RepID=UPI001CB858F7|nr:selenoprotein J isoform X2 [Chiloscyllium plagiosum]